MLWLLRSMVSILFVNCEEGKKLLQVLLLHLKPQKLYLHYVISALLRWKRH